MLSYRHAFHAGNHADVLKHLILVQALRYFNQKEKPYWVVDTHAGAGRYDLASAQAAKNAEWLEGIGRLWNRDDLPPAVADYVAQVRALNPEGRLRHYPGSPLLALQLLREADRLRLFELHGTDFRFLEKAMAGGGTRVAQRQADGFLEIKSVLPPPPRRGFTLMDPAFEDKRDYLRAVMAAKEAMHRFPTGTCLVWYPQLQRGDARQLPEKLKKLPAADWLHVSLTVHAPAADGFGLHGSGLVILNPPWTLAGTLKEAMPYLASVLGRDATAGFMLETGSKEPS
jgi:23S rRNA (adenine2030-N6)-methyltransferase